MHEKEVLERAFAMPLTNPAYSLGPYRFVTRIPHHHISHRSRDAAAVVPEPLKLDEHEAVVKYEFTACRLGHRAPIFACGPKRTSTSLRVRGRFREKTRRSESNAPRPLLDPKQTSARPLATNDLGERRKGPAATVCTRVIAARLGIPVHSFGEPCWMFGRSSHQFWRGTA